MSTHTHTESLGSTGQSQMGRRGPGQGAGRKIGGNNYLHTFQSLISLGECTTHVPSLHYPTSHQLYSLSTTANLCSSEIHLHLKKDNSLRLNFPHIAAFVTTSLKLGDSHVIDFKDVQRIVWFRLRSVVHYILMIPTVTVVTAGCAGEFREGAN